MVTGKQFLFLWTKIRNKLLRSLAPPIKEKYLITVTVIAIAAVAVYFLGTSITGQYVADDDYDDLAKCLTEKGAVMYGRTGCGWCSKQKELFGDSFQYVTYVECTDEPTLCQQKGVTAVPTWEIDGTLHPGFKPLEDLAGMVGCTL